MNLLAVLFKAKKCEWRDRTSSERLSCKHRSESAEMGWRSIRSIKWFRGTSLIGCEILMR